MPSWKMLCGYHQDDIKIHTLGWKNKGGRGGGEKNMSSPGKKKKWFWFIHEKKSL